MIRRTLWACAALALACGGGEAPEIAGVDPGAAAQAPADEHGVPVVNHAPVIEQLALDPERPRPGEQVVARVSASDPDGDAVDLSYRWTLGGKRMDETGPFLHVEGAGRDAEIEVTVVASDGKEESRPKSASARVGNLAPRVLQVVLEPLGEVRADRDVRATPSGTDLDGDPIEYRYRWSVNGEVVPDAGATLAAEHYQRGDEILLEVVASDGIEDSEPLRSAPIEVVNAPPRITSSPGAIGADGVFRYDVVAEDVDGDTSFRYRLTRAPEGMTIGFDDGRLVWEPGPGVAGNHPVEIEVADLFGGKATQTFELRLSYAEEPPAAQDEAGPQDEEAESD